MVIICLAVVLYCIHKFGLVEHILSWLKNKKQQKSQDNHHEEHGSGDSLDGYTITHHESDSESLDEIENLKKENEELKKEIEILKSSDKDNAGKIDNLQKKISFRRYAHHRAARRHHCHRRRGADDARFKIRLF